VRGQRHASVAPYPRERLGTHCTGGWVGPRAGLDWCGKSRPTGIRFPDRPARRQSLYRLSYPAHKLIINSLILSFPLKFCLVLFYTAGQWPRGLRRRSSAARPLRLWVRIPSGAWIFVSCECCVLSGRGFCDGLITRPEESYRLWRVVVCDHETSKTRRLKPATGL